jgi:hypothetical protein
MFPPPQPWKTVGAIDPDRSYVAFTSRFALRSFLRLPAFMRKSLRIQRQLQSAPGLVGFSLGGDLFKRNFYTLSAWEDAASLHAFAHRPPHDGALTAFAKDLRAPSIFVQWTVKGATLPLRWPDALARQRESEAAR